MYAVRSILRFGRRLSFYLFIYFYFFNYYKPCPDDLAQNGQRAYFDAGDDHLLCDSSTASEFNPK